MKTRAFIIGMVMLPAVASAALTTGERLIIQEAILDVKHHQVVSYNILKPKALAEFAFQTGKPDNIGETLRAFTFLESTFGQTSRVGDHGDSRGCTQISISKTARFILDKLLNIKTKWTDQELEGLYTYNDKVSIIMSKEYLLYLMNKFKYKPANWSHAVLGYNRGPNAVNKDGLTIDPNNYVAKAKKFIKENRK